MRLLFLGDSITCSDRFYEPPLGNGYVDALSERFCGKGEYEFINRGIDGFTAGRLLEHVEDYKKDKGDVVFIQIGINDVALMMNTRRSELQIRKMMGDFILRYEKLACIMGEDVDKLFFVETFLFPVPAYHISWMSIVEKLNEGIKDLSAKCGAEFIPIHKELNEAGRRLGLDRITIDGVHLTRSGHEILADRIYEYLK